MKREVGSRYCHQLPTINDNVYFPLWLRHWQNRYYLKVSADYKMQNNANNSSHDSSKIHYTLCRSFSSRKTNATSITFQEIFAIYNSYCIAPAVTDYWYNQCTENCQHLIVIISEPVEFAQDFFFSIGEYKDCDIDKCSPSFLGSSTAYLHVYFRQQWGFWIYCKHLGNVEKWFARQMHLSIWSLDPRSWWCLLGTLSIQKQWPLDV